eukprot:8435197-Pyramimonas_sp.AAC.1
MVVAGHAAGAVKVAAPRQRAPKRRAPGPSPDGFETFAEFKQAAEEATWATRRATFQKYIALRESDPGRAERFLSSWFRGSAPVQVALDDPTTGEAMSQEQMVQALVEDLFTRAQNSFPQN